MSPLASLFRDAVPAHSPHWCIRVAMWAVIGLCLAVMVFAGGCAYQSDLAAGQLSWGVAYSITTPGSTPAPLPPRPPVPQPAPAANAPQPGPAAVPPTSTAPGPR